MSIPPGTDLTTLVGPEDLYGEPLYGKLVEACFADKRFGNARVEMLAQFTLEEFLKEYPETKKQRIDLKKWVEYHHLEPHFNIDGEGEPQKFTVYVLNQHGAVTARCVFREMVLPATRTAFFAATSLDSGIGSGTDAHVSVSMQHGWSSLDENPKPSNQYKHNEEEGVLYQLSRSHTPSTSPSIAEGNKKGMEKTPFQFKEIVSKLFPSNPFAVEIPKTHTDEAIQKMRGFFQLPLKPEPDSDVLATVLAMPGSGKTRTVVEAAYGMGLEYRRYKMANVPLSDLSSADDVRVFLHKTICEILGCEEVPETYKGKTVVIHFDEIQVLMVQPDGDAEDLVVTLSKEIDKTVNHPPYRYWLKFVLTGTNVFTRRTIKFKSEVKSRGIALNGSFPIDFVSDLMDDYGMEEIKNTFDPQSRYRERCRHNRRFTQRFLSNLWDQHMSQDISVNIENAYQQAFEDMKEQMSNHIAAGTTVSQVSRVSQVACSVFAKILAMEKPKTANPTIYLQDCSAEEAKYIEGGGLNVAAVDREGIRIYYPDGVVLEILESFLGRSGAIPAGNTVLSFLNVHSVCGFGIRGHLLEWLIAYDISCAMSEIERIMPGNRSQSCIGAKVGNHPLVYNKIKDDPDKSIWVVRDTHDSHQDRWVDVAYKLDNAGANAGGWVLMDCKTGYKGRYQGAQIKAMRNSFFEKAKRFALSNAGLHIVATFACERDDLDLENPSDLPANMSVQDIVVDQTSCPTISSFLGADALDTRVVDGSIAETFEQGLRAASDDGAPPYLGASSQQL